MSCDQTFKNLPYTGTASSNYEVTITADNAVPTAVGDANVTFAPQTGVNAAVNRLGPREVMIKGRFTGTAAATADCVVALWLWDKDAEQWHKSNGVPIGGTTTIAGSLTKGSMGKVDSDPNARLGYLQVSGIVANQDIVLMVTKRA
jgi:hypothetical protein